MAYCNTSLLGTYEKNEATVGAGGAVYIKSTSQGIGCTYEGGPGMWYGSGAVKLIRNTAKTDGGGIYIEESWGTGIAGVTANNNTAGGNGGAIYLNGYVPYFQNSEFTENKAANGGALYITDYIDSNMEPIFNEELWYADTWEEVSTKILFQNNEATSNGGAVYSTHSINVKGTVMDGNSATKGGAIYNSKSINVLSSQAKASSITNNTANQGVRRAEPHVHERRRGHQA